MTATLLNKPLLATTIAVTAPFRFKQFEIHQDSCAMKVGTDAILLGSWVQATEPSAILDIGTGTGVIALMLAQRFPAANIDAVEIDSAACDQAKDNFARSLWADRLTVQCNRAQEFCARHSYDLIVSNPPYFRTSFKPVVASRRTARHDDALTSLDLVDAANRLLSADGRFNVVIPMDRNSDFNSIAKESHLYCVRRCSVRPTPNHPPKRLLMEFARQPVDSPKESEFAIEVRRHEYSPEYAALAKEFLLKL